MLSLVSVRVQASMAGAGLLVHRIVAWSFLTTFGCIAEGVVLALVVGEDLVMLVYTVPGCS